jgi:inward rectifier potassium channel
MIKKTRKQEIRDDEKDLGFGTRLTAASTRLLNRDGSFNVRRRGLSFWRTFDPYQHLIRMSWPRFIGVILLAYTVENLLFATIYVTIGIENLDGVVGKTPLEHFAEAFFFSSQTITTLGYGRISPIGFWASAVAALESMLGIMGFALITGLLYGRFSRPSAKLVYSEKSLISPYRDGAAWMFRLANVRSNQLIEVEVEVTFSRVEQWENGKKVRQFYALTLERSKVNFLALSWTIVHPVDADSPLHGVTPDDLRDADAEFIILIKAFDDTYSQTVHTRSSYRYDEVTWGARFLPMFEEAGDDKNVRLNLHRISSCERAELPAHMARLLGKTRPESLTER